MEIVGPLMLITPDGRRLSAQGLTYDGPALGEALPLIHNALAAWLPH